MVEELEEFFEWKLVDLTEWVALEQLRVFLIFSGCVVFWVSCLEVVEVDSLQPVEKSPEDQSS